MPKGWECKESSDGISIVVLKSWRHFDEYIRREMVDYGTYIYRGQQDESWKLEPTLDRVLKQRNRLRDSRARSEHLKRFKFAVRGRRKSDIDLIENDWWALGQHYGLHTPLLDWTTSPFVAAFFAFRNEDRYAGKDQTCKKSSKDGSRRVSRKRVVYALNEDQVRKKSKETRDDSIIEFIRPLSNENNRLVNQAGLFSRSPDGEDIETWVRRHFQGEQNSILIKINIPSTERDEFLKYLSRMNINDLTLFPDLIGASRFCNLSLVIDQY